MSPTSAGFSVIITCPKGQEVNDDKGVDSLTISSYLTQRCEQLC